MRTDLFILIIGYGRTGTSLCTGLLNYSPELNIGYELNNQLIYSPNKEKFLKKYRIISNGGVQMLSYEFNGNKIAVNSTTFLEIIKPLLEKKTGFIHDRFDTLKVIFTRRNAVDTMVSRKKRMLDKGIDLSVKELVSDYLAGTVILSELKKFFTEKQIGWYLFDFDEILDKDTLYFAKKLFDFVGEPFKDEYVLEYRGVKNYTHAIGVSRRNTLFGRKDKFLNLRAEIIEELARHERVS